MDKVPGEYLRNAVLTATPERLHLMLYDGAIRFTRQGIEGLQQKKWEEAFNGFSRAQKIVLEMLNSLNYDVDKDLCTRMAGLYNFIYRKLLEASVQRQAASANEALRILEFQRETWVMVIDKIREERSAQSLPPSDDLPDGESADVSYGTLSVQG